ncbi:MAG: hypothetical protein AMJ43_11410 [Coxiella sp. DG_40]|nr:MAG: hypothetical protein AMJ43_11410 [Coxiella sp. DG_40]
MNSLSSYKRIIEKHVLPFLEELGFRRFGDSFKIIVSGNIGIIDFQKSNKSTNNHVFFTVNLAVILHSLYEFEGFHTPIEKLREENGHWRERLGYLLPERSDVWWEVSKDTDMDAIGHELVLIIKDYAIPEIMQYISDENLMNLWIEGKSPGLTNIQRLEYLTVLLKLKGYNKFLQKAIEELKTVSRGKPYEHAVKIHLRLLGIS